MSFVFCYRNILHNGPEMIQSMHFEYMIARPIIVPIATIHSEHIVSYNTEVLTAEF